jgi:hypothetical protein
MAQDQLQQSSKVCATCLFWGGNRSVEFRGYSKFETNQKDKCMGGAFRGLETSPMQTCHKWEVWPLIRK